jgi:hypothetical protein
MITPGSNYQPTEKPTRNYWLRAAFPNKCNFTPGKEEVCFHKIFQIPRPFPGF